MVNLRHKFHMNPELAFNEIETSKTVANELEKLDIQVKTNIAQTGVMGLMNGKYPGRTVLLRADMDALPISEDVPIEFKSKIDGIMHACGHDGHTAALLGTAMILNDLKDKLHGNIKFVFQPAEEGEGGAKLMIDEGILENPKVDAAFACHLWGDVLEGHIEIKQGAIMASSDDFKFKVLGKGGHGSTPHLCIDPINIAIQVITNIQMFISRRVNPIKPVVVSFCSIHGGRGINSIPDEVEVMGTIRTFDNKTRDFSINAIKSILKSVTESEGAGYEFNYISFAPPVINDYFMTDMVIKSATEILGEDKILNKLEPNMGAEDFAFFSNSIPSALFLVGIMKEKEIIAHSSNFNWDDKNLKTSAKCLAQVAVNFLES